MKNLKKLIAILASASMIMSLGATAFAEEEAPKPGLDTTAGTLTFVVDNVDISQSNDEFITLMAYSVPASTNAPVDFDAEAGHVIIALDQATGLTGFATVNFDTAKLIEGSEKVMVKVGGSEKKEPIEWLLGVTDTPAGPVITFVNGAVSTTPVQLANGKVAEPADAKYKTWDADKTPAEGYDFTFYAWVDENGKEYPVSNGQVDLTGVTADTTLYAKYATGIIVGEVDDSGEVDPDDGYYIERKYYFSSTRYPNIGAPIYNGSEILIGDVDGSGEVDPDDGYYIERKYYFSSTRYPNIGLQIYLTNGDREITESYK